MMKDKDLIYEYLTNIEKPFKLSDIFEETGVKRTKSMEKQLTSLMKDGHEFVAEDDIFYPKIYFLEQIPIRILPTEFEIQRNILILGHRIIPFQPIFESIDSVSLIYNGKKIETKEEKFKMDQIGIYFSLLDLEKMPIKNFNDILTPDSDLEIDVFHLEEFYAKNEFKFGDTIISRSADFKKGIFSIEHDSIENFKSSIFQTKFIDKLFLNKLKKVLELKLSFPSIEKQLLYTYYYIRDEDISIPGTPAGPLISTNKEVVFSALMNGVKVFHFENQNVNDLNVYPDFEDYVDEIKEEDYDLDTTDGILAYLGNNNRETVVRALIFDQLPDEGYDYDKILDYLFYDLEYPYMPEELENKFKELVDSLHEEIKGIYKKYPPSLPVMTARKKILNILLEISKFLRSLDKFEIDVKNLPKDDMYSIIQMSNALEQALVLSEESGTNEKEIRAFLEMAKEAEKNMPEILVEIKKRILES